MPTNKKRKAVTVHLTPTQFSLARRRIFHEHLTWQMVMNALMNAYITGDITVTKQGRYHMAPPQGAVPVIHVPKDGEVVEIDVDWGTKDSRPQVGASNKAQHPKRPRSDSWGTRELVGYLREETGRNVRLASLQLLLRTLEIPKHGGHHWKFTGEDDPLVVEILETFHDGTYDRLIRQGLDKAEVARERRKSKEAEIKNAVTTTEQQRKILHLKRLRSTEEG